MQVLIIEDEPLAADRLIRMIKATDPTIVIYDHVDTVRGAVALLKQRGEEIDLLFCDIQLADGLSFEIFDHVDFHKPVIFTTAYDQYAIDAFKVNSMHYLLKPIKAEELKHSLDKYHRLIKDQPSYGIEQIKRFFDQERRSHDKRLLVKSGVKLIPVKLSEIALFYIKHKNVHAVSYPEERRYLIDHTLDELEKDHLDMSKFFRINRKQIVNLQDIIMIKPYPNQRLQLTLRVGSDVELVVAREKVKKFREWFTK
jgi:DNA-binding LytR/AlgR family response regulator